MSDNEIYLLIKYIKSVLWRVAKCLSYIEEARYLKVKLAVFTNYIPCRSGEGVTVPPEQQARWPHNQFSGSILVRTRQNYIDTF